MDKWKSDDALISFSRKHYTAGKKMDTIPIAFVFNKKIKKKKREKKVSM